MIAALYFGAAIGMAGMPPLSGFLGKLLVLDAARDHALMALIWTSVIVTSLIAIVGMPAPAARCSGRPMPSRPRVAAR
jgi:multicomponent K+:H+ antiporter subunit D